MINKIKTIGVVVIITLSTSGTSVGQIVGSKYGGIQYSTTTYSEAGVSQEFSPIALIGRLGTNFTNSFSVEGRLGLGLQDDSVNVFGTNVIMEVDSLIGVYGVGYISLNKNSSVYGLLGVSRASATWSGMSFISGSDSDAGLSYGIGADVGISDNVALNIEYIQYLNKSDFDVSAFAFGVKFGF